MTEDVPFDPTTGEIHQPPETQNPPRKKTGNGKSRIPPDETKRQKFVRLVDPRVTRALEAIRRVGKLGGGNARKYDFDEDDIGKIVEALSKEVVALEKTMIRGKPENPVFSIDD